MNPGHIPQGIVNLGQQSQLPKFFFFLSFWQNLQQMLVVSSFVVRRFDNILLSKLWDKTRKKRKAIQAESFEEFANQDEYLSVV